MGGGGKDIFTYIIQNVQLKKQNAALSSIFVTIYIYEKKTYIFSLKDGNNTTVNVEASTSSGRDDIWSNFHDYTVQPKVHDAASPDNFSNADPVDQTEDAAVPGNRGTVTQGTNTCEQINYEEKYRKAVHRCEIVLKELIFQKNFNEKTLNQNQNNNQTGCKAVKKMKKKESVISTLKKELSTAKKQNRWLKSKKCFNIRLKRKLKESSDEIKIFK